MPERTVEHDLAIQERYQEFSAELLRISLLGLGAIGFALSQTLFPGETESRVELGAMLMAIVGIALLSFGISAAAALIHRYSSVDSVSWHIQSLRRGLRNDDAEGDARAAEDDRAKRYQQFGTSRIALRVSATALGVASCALAIALVVVMIQLRDAAG